MKISCLNNPFNNDFKNFNVFLTNFSIFSDFKVFSKAPFSDALCDVEATHLTFNESRLNGFSIMLVCTERRLQTDFCFRLKEATKSYRKIIFVSATKISENTTNILNCYFSS